MTEQREFEKLKAQIATVHAGLQAKEALLKQLLDEIPLEGKAFNALLARHGVLATKLRQPSPQTLPEFYDTAVQPGQMGDRGPAN